VLQQQGLVTVEPEVAEAFNDQHTGKNDYRIPVDPVSGVGLITCTPSPNELNQPVTLKNGDEAWIYLFDPKKCPKRPISTQTCRSTPISADVKELNDRVQKALLTPGSPAVLANYELVGAEWFYNGDLPPQPLVQLTNTTLETYLQTLPQGCVLCHSNQGTVGSVGPVPSKPPMQFNSGLADRSFVFQQIRQFGTACRKDQPAGCGAWKDRCREKK
jgi:hypothetical protein